MLERTTRQLSEYDVSSFEVVDCEALLDLIEKAQALYARDCAILRKKKK